MVPEYASIEHGFVLFDDGSVCRIDVLLDANEMPTEDPAEAAGFVTFRDGCMCVVELAALRHTIH